MSQKIAFITNAREYAGPGAVAAMTAAGWAAFCHDDSFVDAEARARFELDNPGAAAAAANDPARFVEEGLALMGRIDALISVNVPKRLTVNPWAPGAERLDDLLIDGDAYMDSLAVDPIRLLRAALPTMREAAAGSIVMVTSGGPLRNPGMAGTSHAYIAAHAAVHSLVRTLALELAPSNIQINAVAPWVLYSQTFFPSELGIDDPALQARAAKIVPMRRFGRPEEIGATIAFLTSGEATYVTGQVIAFSGGAC